MTHQHQHDQQQDRATRERRNNDIDNYGYLGAFRRDEFYDSEKYKLLGGKNDERREHF